MTAATHLIRKMRSGVQNVAYGNPLYQKMLAVGEAPQKLVFTPADPWPGDAQAGQILMAGPASLFERAESVAMRHAATALRNLRAVGTDSARAACVRLIDGWLGQFDRWNETEWQAGSLGSRLSAWVGFYDFYAPAASPDFKRRLIGSLFRQWKHLMRTASPALTGIDGIQAARGLIYGGLNFAEGDAALSLACDLVQRQVANEILADGGHASRNPCVQLHMLRHLVDIRNVLELAGIRMPESIGAALSSMIAPLKFFRHGDGGLALFHGGQEGASLMIDAVLNQAVIRGRVLRRLTETGYERLTAGRSLLLVDAAAPPVALYRDGHAGLMSFEFSVGRERLIVNCGARPETNNDWRAACAASAAHSTLIVDDTNACDIDREGGILSPPRAAAQRFEESGSQGVEMSHDGYRSRYGLTHHRILLLSGDGETLTGRDLLQGDQNARQGCDFALRWHLHPGVQVSLSQSGQTALLRTASGSGWRLRVESGHLSLEPSIYCGEPTPRRTMQIKLATRTSIRNSAVGWSLSRERKS